MSQQLKVGQVWKDREGNEIELERNTGPHWTDTHPFQRKGRPETYTKDGIYSADGVSKDRRDLIELIRDVPDESSKPTLKVGQVWRSRCGETIELVHNDGTSGGDPGTYPFMQKGGCLTYTSSGSWYQEGEDSADLIELIRDVSDSDGWITWNGGECPVSGDTRVVVKLRDGLIVTECKPAWLQWGHKEILSDIVAYRIVEPPAKSEQPHPNPKHAHYFKSVAHLDTVDVYRVCELFGVTDQAIGHAIKKLLCAGQRGVKDQRKDVQEAIDTLTRRVAMWQEEGVVK